MNQEKLQSVQQKLEAFLAQEKEQKERAQRCFVSYLRSVYLMKNKDVFDVFKLQIHEYALSLGLAVAPRVRFLNKAQEQRVGREERRAEQQSEDDEEELRSFQAQLRGERVQDESGASADEDEEDPSQAPGTDDEDDLRDLDLLTVKRTDVFSVMEDQVEPKASEEHVSSKKTSRDTKFKEAKKLLRRNFQVNTKVAFSDSGDAVQLWPPVQREGDEDDEDEVSGIDVEKAKVRLRREDQEFDRPEFRRKVKAKHREQRLRAKAERRDASRQHTTPEDGDEDEVVAYLANHSEDEFDPSTLPDPDRLHMDRDEEEEDEDEDEFKQGSAKRRRGSSEDEFTARKTKMRKSEEEDVTVLDTGLSLAEDEDLVLQLLAGRR